MQLSFILRSSWLLLCTLAAVACGARADLQDVPLTTTAKPTDCLEQGVWRDVASMNEPRYLHASVALPDGRAAVIAGSSVDTFLASIEVYDPAIDSWRYIADLSQPRMFHAATVLSDGRVLITGGYTGASDGSGAGISLAEIFDPTTGTVTQTAAMPQGRYFHASVLLPDGRVLITGGFQQDVGVQAAAIFDPSLNAWSTLAAPMEVAGNYVAGSPHPEGAYAAAYPGIYLFRVATGQWRLLYEVPDEMTPFLNVPLSTRVNDGFAVVDNYGHFAVGDVDSVHWTRLWRPEGDQPVPQPSAILSTCNSIFVLADRSYQVSLDNVDDVSEQALNVLGSTGVALADGSLLVTGGTTLDGLASGQARIYR